VCICCGDDHGDARDLSVFPPGRSQWRSAGLPELNQTRSARPNGCDNTRVAASAGQQSQSSFSASPMEYFWEDVGQRKSRHHAARGRELKQRLFGFKAFRNYC